MYFKYYFDSYQDTDQDADEVSYNHSCMSGRIYVFYQYFLCCRISFIYQREILRQHKILLYMCGKCHTYKDSHKDSHQDTHQNSFTDIRKCSIRTDRISFQLFSKRVNRNGFMERGIQCLLLFIANR